MLKKILFGFSMCAMACGAETTDATTADEANVTGDATLSLTSDFTTSLRGAAKAGSALRVEYS